MFPEKTKKGMLIISLMVCMVANVFALSNPYAPESTQVAVTGIADRLVDEQLGDGAWPDRGAVPSGWWTGTMAAGLVDAHWMTCDPSYKAAAELAGDWILDHADGCSFYYDDINALMQLSEIHCTPSSNTWRTALEDYYACVESQPYDPLFDKAGTELVIAELEAVQGIPWVVMTVAHYTVGAYYADAADKVIWRDELIRLLEEANAPHAEQVMMLGVATWALAQTGGLDDTSCYVGSPLSDEGVAEQLDELPGLLASYQVPSNSANAAYRSHFITIYNYPNESFSGYTETNIYAAMGLAAAQKYAGFDYRSEIDDVWAVNMQPVDQNEDVWWDAVEIPGTTASETYYHYAGEYLQYLAATRLPGDTDSLDSVDMDDLAYFASQWLGPLGCTSCNRADLNRDRKVNLVDFAELAQGWMLSR